MHSSSRRVATVAMAVIAVGLLTAPAGYAAEPVTVVHTETTEVGPYTLTTSFSEWPLRAEKSLDFLFSPDGGIDGLDAAIRPVTPSGEVFLPQPQSTEEGTPLARHPRALDSWGFDVVALTAEGTWTFEFSIDGPEGRGTGSLEVPVGVRPGPPAPLAWAVGLLPLAALLPLGGYMWTRTRPGRQPETWTWT